MMWWPATRMCITPFRGAWRDPVGSRLHIGKHRKGLGLDISRRLFLRSSVGATVEDRGHGPIAGP
jgi:hypothetical protein